MVNFTEYRTEIRDGNAKTRNVWESFIEMKQYFFFIDTLGLDLCLTSKPNNSTMVKTKACFARTSFYSLICKQEIK